MSQLSTAPDLIARPDTVRPAARRVLWARRLRARLLPPLAVLAVVVAAWYAGSYALIDPSRQFLLPPPHEVVRVALLDRANLLELLQALSLSAQVAVIGLGGAVLIGVVLAVLMSQARWVERSLYPYAVILQTVPVLALVPLFGFWFGFGFGSRVLVCILIAIFPIIANTLFGLRSVDRGQRDLFALSGASRLTVLRKLELPAALPAIFTGLRIAAGASVIGAIVGDFFFQQGQAGIGQLISIYPRRLQSEMLFGAVLLSSLFGLVVFWIFSAISRQVTAWHESVLDRPNVASANSA